MSATLQFVLVLVAIIASTVPHELMHGVVAYLLGDNTAKEAGRLSLNPLKHIDPVMSILVPIGLYLLGGPIFGGAKPVPVDNRRLKGGSWGMALVAIAGPLTNFVLALVCFLIGYHTGLFSPGANQILAYLMAQLVMVNLGFLVFNLIPIPPLDGSRVLYAIAPDGVRRGMEWLERSVGITLVMLLVLVFGTAFATLTSGMMQNILGFFYWLVGA